MQAQTWLHLHAAKFKRLDCTRFQSASDDKSLSCQNDSDKDSDTQTEQNVIPEPMFSTSDPVATKMEEEEQIEYGKTL